MQTEHGWLIGPGDKVLQVDEDGVVTFNVNNLDTLYLLTLDPIAGDDRATFTTADGQLLGCDATRFTPSGNVCQCYYAIRGPRGNYESWQVGQWDSGIVEAVVRYKEQGADNGRAWQVAGLTWVRK